MVEIEVLTIADAPRLQAVFEAAGDYFARMTGRSAPGADAAERELRSAEGAGGRAVAVIRAEDDDIGSIGWWAGSPEPDRALLGMLLIVPTARGRGHARAALAALERRLAADGIATIQTAVGAEDRVSRGVAEALGFRSLDRSTHVDMDGGRLRIAFYEKPLETGE